MFKNAILLFVFAFVIMLIFLPAFSRMQDLRQKDRQYQAHITELEAENARLKEERRKLETDPAYLEKVAREKMGLIKKGEVVYELPPEMLGE